MNLVTLPIYNRSSIVDLSPASIQLAITQRVEWMVLKHTNDQSRASGSIHVSNAGKIILGLDAHAAFDEISDSCLLDSIRSWNKKRNTTDLKLDDVTIQMARLIEDEFTHPLGDDSLTRANIAAHITTECHNSVLKNPRVADNTTSVLADQVTGERLYLGNSDVGSRLSAQIKHSLQHNNSGSPDIFIVQAPQGAGKTNWLTQLISDTNRDGNNHTLCLSPRRQITASLFNDIMKITSIDPDDVLVGASSLKHKHTHTRHRPADEYHITLTTINSMEKIWKFIDERPRLINRLIDQALQDEITEQEYAIERKKLDTLSVSGSIFSSIPTQDLIVCDEFQLLRSSIVSGTHINDEQAFTIRRYMSHLEQQSKAVVVLDADLDASVVDYFALNHPNSKIHISKCIIPERREIYLHQDNDTLMCWLLDQIKLIECVNEDDPTPASFAVPCTSTKVGRWLKQVIHHMRPDLKVLWIEAGNKNENEQQSVLQDPSLACDYDVVIYSPKIFTGFSFDPVIIDGHIVPVANKVVGLFGGRKINWMERAQALFRIRNCNEFHFSVMDTEVDDDEDETITKDDIREFRENTLFDCDGLRIPLPKTYYANDNMIRQFRARGFELFDQPSIDGADKQLADIKRAMKLTTSRDTKLDQATTNAREFVDLLVQRCGLESELTPGQYVLFSGKLRDGFSVIFDRLLEEHPIVSDWISMVIPKWKRNYKYDVATIHKMITAANNNLELVVDRRNMLVDGIRHNIFHLTLVAYPTDLHV